MPTPATLKLDDLNITVTINADGTVLVHHDGFMTTFTITLPANEAVQVAKFLAPLTK